MKVPRPAQGFSLIETLIYTGILIFIVVVVGSTILAFSRVYRSIIAEQHVEHAADALERILRETRNATSIDASGSTFGNDTGVLSLNTKDEDGDAVTLQFFTDAGTIRMNEDTADIGPLTATSTNVTKLLVTSITTAKSKAIRVELTVESGTSTHYRTKTYYGTAVLRG